ncbi:MAG: serine hydrolase [Andreesenia angusta]|nr:serine hydrolase [Andreesenia angusta]
MKIENLEAKILYRDNKIIESFGNIDKKVPINSITKTIIAILIGIAKTNGIIEDIKDPANHYIREYDIDQRISIESLLTMSSGINCPENLLYNSNDWIDTISNSEVLEEKIGKFEYRGASSHLLGKIISDSADMSLEDFAIEYLFNPLGIDYDKDSEEIDYYIEDRLYKSKRTWDIDPKGNNMGSFALRLSANDLLKIGRMILDKGIVKGKRILSEDYIKASFKPQIKAENYGYYTYQAWFKNIKGYKVYSAIGIDDKYMSIIPEKNTILIFISKIKREKKTISIQKSYIESLLKAIV